MKACRVALSVALTLVMAMGAVPVAGFGLEHAPEDVIEADDVRDVREESQAEDIVAVSESDELRDDSGEAQATGGGDADDGAAGQEELVEVESDVIEVQDDAPVVPDEAFSVSEDGVSDGEAESVKSLSPQSEAGAKEVSTAAKKGATAKRQISKASVSKIATQPYTGKPVKPTPVVKWGKTKLKRGTHYTLSYANNTAAGTATITIRGKGSYTGTKKVSFRIVSPSVAYYVHGQSYGWEQAWSRRDGATAGTIGMSKRVEALKIKLARKPVAGSILYRSHIQGVGWETSWHKDGARSGTVGASKRVEAIKVKLSGTMLKKYNVYYRVHAQHFGWMGWAKNGEAAGTEGYSYRVEAIQIRLVPKGRTGPTAPPNIPAFRRTYPSGKTGWQNPADYPQVSANTVRLPVYCVGEHTYVTPSRIAVNATREQCVEAFITRAYEYLGTPYREPWARQPGIGIDCSGLVLQCVYATGMDLEHARGTEKVGGYNPYNHFWVPEQTSNSMRWYENGTFMPIALADIRRGDLVFYEGHVAIYLGNNKIIHSVSGAGCIVDELWHARPIGAQRPYV